MELFRTNEFYIFVKDEYSLWWDRNTGAFIPKTGWDLPDAEDPVCLGVCDGIIGKVEYVPLFDPKLLLIKDSASVGKLHGDNDVYKIKSVVFLPLNHEEVTLNLKPCQKHQTIGLKRVTNTNSLLEIQKNTLSKTWGTLKSAGNTIKNTTQQAAAIATGMPKRDIKDKDKFEKQIIEEFYKIFTDTNSFYYSRTTDLTNSLQRLCNLEKNNLIDSKCLWKTVDDKFFWNKHMLGCLINSQNSLCDPWILPIIQGYIQIEDCKVDVGNFLDDEDKGKHYEIFTLCILSRRSRFRAGTRYKRRGVDEDGEVANYVETEQIIMYQSHEVSFLQVRGSVPVFWSQPGYKYRPPPRLDKGENENCVAFDKHFTKEIKKYGPISAVNLVDQTGKEKVIFDAYSNHMLQLDSPFLTYVTFDFHEYCKGMHFENVSILIGALEDILKDMNYCWRDKQGHICSQNGVFRVNCMDCLDRTNVVQTALGKAVMEMQFCKLGLVSPEGEIPNNIKVTFQLLWANNGDIISKQYAGTNALKGDYTRTGERKFTGIMKDGMNSANRYFTNHFKDSVRQCALDVAQGLPLRDYEIQDFWAYLRVASCIATEYLPEEAPSVAPHLALQQEFELAHLVYQMSRYYLSRFKDSARQGTIDIMLGNYVSEDVFSDAKSNYEEDNIATAEHVKLLIEDCKKMLINQPELVVGSWGLINADPIVGDPSETEMDSILILTRDSYYVADYDDQVDKVTKYQRVELKDIDLLEFGMPQSTGNLFKLTRNKHCIRINYKVDGVSGYYHMFRSTQLRFFNNMAVLIKNVDEEIESLKTICEAFSVAIDIAGLPPVPLNLGQALDKRKSKVLVDRSTTSSSIYLDLASLPQITRNVSETQLSAIKSAGSKAISNMTQQFSKLNKISFKSKLKPKPRFTIGQSTRPDSTSESDEEYEDSIFQPRTSPGSGTDSSGAASVEQGLECTESSMLNEDVFLPSVGIVMGQNNSTSDGSEGMLEEKKNMVSGKETSQMNHMQLTGVVHGVAPEIQVTTENVPSIEQKLSPPRSLKLHEKHSRSSGEIDDPSLIVEYKAAMDRSSSDYDIQKNISQSQSDSGLKNRLASPVSSARELFSPLSRLAKGVQTFGANLDPRKLATQTRQMTARDVEEHKKMMEKWSGKKCKLIAL
ncbi:phosphatidylinositide phosphatase spermathreecae isoform X1 [Rhynchophorus ferrugineus]|uniref:phosphatidylinositide phosphatase spermathreecae isoform X1 n=1 Tax=Rhynchophorus ferrugineus TaxID=354439 RepID=UPI003FCE383C